MTPYWTSADGRHTLYCGDALAVLHTLETGSVEAIVTDPPAGIGFMGKGWDHHRGGRDAWVAWLASIMRDALRVLKPGGHALIWALPRTSHWTALALEDAGFEIRDRVSHLFGSGFPKSLDISKAIDKAAGAERECIGPSRWLGRDPSGKKPHSSLYTDDNWQGTPDTERGETAPATDAARQWDGWGTALAPACEDWWLCRKPLGEPTVAANVLKHGTGGLHIDACRVEPTGENLGGSHVSTKAEGWDRPWKHNADHIAKRQQKWAENDAKATHLGRWPKNITHDGSPEVLAGFPEAPGQQRAVGPRDGVRAHRNAYQIFLPSVQHNPRDDTGSAARFFYTAKSSPADRGAQNTHPTVKSTSLMRWLLRLITPQDATVLDCFAGSGSTGVAAIMEGMRFIGIEQDPAYCAIAVTRLQAALQQPTLPGLDLVPQPKPAAPQQGRLF